MVPLGARADGTLFQFDASSSSATGVLVVQRGQLQFGLQRSNWTGGYHWLGRIAWKQPLSFGSLAVTLGVGPAVQYDQGGIWKDGISAFAESYIATSWGGVYALVDLNSIDRS